MIFKELAIPGVYLISIEKHEDERGFFARSFCQKEFAEYGLCTEFLQCNLSYNKKKGTLRGMHYQIPPYEEVKVVSCLQGAIYDVALDVRKNSKTYGKWVAAELSAENHQMLYIPAGVAHGFQSLRDDSIVYYQMGSFYQPDSGEGIGYNDERFNIQWPILDKIISKKDQSY
ncbi:dTDP-4-dehydrorhamnose 3,5-epimerase [Propionispira raffinosivorans]|uniref:dTDP-4-dehydrorhamnose 3,5-epimerase n=1 Tax=Propionispira raffinosivorans TaxID=86959 RepID=UPI00036A6C6F|nr:dTDP-4-dehydrorhamnose 3,5-epimerase [Propionispira raffinosivorans]